MGQHFLPGLNELAEKIHARNVRLGFYDPETVRPLDGQLMNVVTEVAEVQEEWRKGRGMTETYWSVRVTGTEEYELSDSLRERDGKLQVRTDSEDDFFGPLQGWADMTRERLRNMPNMIRHLKPEGIPTELADIIIRVLDICGANNIDIQGALDEKMEYNMTRPYRHGGKRS